jgi:toxin FitB
VVVAALAAWHEQHELAADALAPVSALPAHVLLETYSVLTRLPAGLAVPAAAAARALAERFREPPLRLGAAERRRLPAALGQAGVIGGSAYDGLVALEARAHGHTLLTLDERAQRTYARLAAPFRVPGT